MQRRTFLKQMSLSIAASVSGLSGIASAWGQSPSAALPAAPLGRSLLDFISPDLHQRVAEGRSNEDLSDSFRRALTAGGRIVVPGGTYVIGSAIRVLLQRSTALICAPDARIVFSGGLGSQAFRIEGAGLYSFDVEGGTFDMSAVTAKTVTGDVGTVFDLFRTRRWSLERCEFIAGTSLSELNGDSALDAVDCGPGAVMNCIFQGWADGGLYLSGGNDLKANDDGDTTVISNCVFRFCSTGVQVKRRNRHVRVHTSHFHRCHVGVGAFAVGAGEVRPGDRMTIIANSFVDCVTPIEMRGGEGLSMINENRIEDFGYLDSGRAVSPPCAILLKGASDCMISGNMITLSNRKRTHHRGISIEPYSVGQNIYAATNNVVRSNTFMRLATGVYASGTGPTQVGGNGFIDVLQEQDIAAPP
ncbi:hypothetical protein [Bosea beijingensis]|uniref:hypothetical protein n=1 Tax=Bosea beijingensis TaxID=3068632 RepID=UPI002740AA1D|nr:hypothetical protein [Bosea sp. REN20]